VLSGWSTLITLNEIIE